MSEIRRILKRIDDAGKSYDLAEYVGVTPRAVDYWICGGKRVRKPMEKLIKQFWDLYMGDTKAALKTIEGE